MRTHRAQPHVTAEQVALQVGVGQAMVDRGMRVTMNAAATGTPTPTLSWYRNGKQLRNNSRYEVGSDGSLLIRKVNRRDEGTFEVRAVNSVGRDSDTIGIWFAGTIVCSTVCRFQIMRFFC